MKIALVVPGGVDRSGEYRVVPAVLALLRRLSRRHEVHVFALRQEAEPAQWMLEGACIHNIGGHRLTTTARAVLAVLREHRRCGGFDLVQSLWSGSSGLVAVLAARLLGLPSAVHYTGGELLALREIGYGGRLNWRGRLREALVLRGATRVTASSWPIVELIAALGRTAQRLPLGVDLDAWPQCKPAARDLREPVRLIHVASLNAVKDQATLLRAMALLAAAGIRFHLDVVGEDTLGGSVQTLARHLKLMPHRICFHGFMTQGQLRPLFERAHINVVSSLHEAGPFVLLEAAASGLPSVGTAVGHLKEWAPDATLAVAPRDPVALAASIRILIDDEALRLRTAEAAQRRAEAEDADHTAALFDRLYAEMTAVPGVAICGR